ncbi:MAG: putative superfamily hydrolase, partial [Pseudonocardiales bacterium]|nr:putative superfamily hydrolase [Pseudonocardiales bacterium]
MSGPPPTPVVVATDLDRTLIYSRNAMGLPLGDPTDLTCVEIYADQPFSFITTAAAQVIADLHVVSTFVPVTTRTPAQLARVTLPGPTPEFAVAANGGALIIDGVRDLLWDKQVAARLREVAPLLEVAGYLGQVCRPEWTSNLRDADGLFCYAVVDRSVLPNEFVDETRSWAAGRGWITSLQGRKLYLMPSSLTKAGAVLAIADRVGAEMILAAGDSLLDRDLLECAHFSIRPRHGELFESGWQNASVMTSQSGIRAGEEIARWFMAECSG